jgi:putative transposase
LPVRRSSPRAKGFDYRGGYRYHVTFVTHERREHLVEPAHANMVIAALLGAASATEFEIDAYCAMPDHVHVLIRGESAACSLHAFAHRFKQATGFAFKRATGEQLWQRSYHDHVLRPDEPSLPHAEYILLNPVAAGLVRNEVDWPFSGPRWWFEAETDRSEDLSLRDGAFGGQHA